MEKLGSKNIDCREDSKIKDRLYELCKTEPSKRSLLADIISRIGTSEALIVGLSLIHDELKPSIPYELSRGLENAFLGRQPYGGGYAYTIEPMIANDIRRHLFEMALKDKHRERSSLILLGQIEAWRLEYGRPDNEPRHPAFDSGKPWPLFEKIDGDTKGPKSINATFSNNSVKENAK